MLGKPRMVARVRVWGQFSPVTLLDFVFYIFGLTDNFIWLNFVILHPISQFGMDLILMKYIFLKKEVIIVSKLRDYIKGVIGVKK